MRCWLITATELACWYGGAREKVKCGGGQRVLVGAAVDVGARQLLGRSVRGRAYRQVCCGDSADVVKLAGYPEVCQEDSRPPGVVRPGEQDIGGFDIAMQQAALVGVIERSGHGGHDGDHLGDGHAGRILAAD